VDEKLRQLLRARAKDVPALHQTPAYLPTRARRRIAFTYGAGALIVLVLVIGSVVGVHRLGAIPPHLPANTLPTGPVLRHRGEIAMLARIPHERFEGLVALDPVTRHTRILARCSGPCEGISEFNWSPGGRWIAYRVITCVAAPPCEPQAGVWVKGAIGPPHQVMSAREGPYEWSPDGTKLLFVEPGATSSTIEMMDPDGSHHTSLAQTGPRIFQVRWSPDGARIAYVQSGQIYVMNADGSDQKAITDALHVGDFNWSPDGTKITLETLQDGRDQVWVINAHGSELRRLIDEPSFEGPSLPVWSPDGTRLAYLATPGPVPTDGAMNGHFGVQIWAMNPDGFGVTKLYDTGCCPGPNFDGPVWSPDSSRVAFQIGQGWLVTRADGGGEPRPIDTVVPLGWRRGS
jgi:Tol biopolymer transport system component